MIVAFFAMNAPVNDAVSKWTQATVPLDWTSDRMRWESGHTIAALLSVVSLAALIRAFLQERSSDTGQSGARSRANQLLASPYPG